MRKKTGLLVVGLLFIFVQAVSQKLNVGLIREHCDKSEIEAIYKDFSNNTKLSIKPISIQAISAETLKGLAAVWYHRTDTGDFTPEEIEAGSVLRNFVKSGGALFLSMESLGLLNKWGIESKPVQMQQDTVKDEGFGRPLGFHAFKDHALFDGLLGGVYTSKQKEDHIVRKHGFFDGLVPENGKVAGIQWTYITFWENNKLLMEYSLGKGKVIAAGAYIYFSPQNDQRQHLIKFTENVFSYATGKMLGFRNYYWDYSKPKVEEYDFKVAPVPQTQADRWNLPKPTLKLKQKSPTNNFYDLVGRQIVWMGKMNSGVEEIWMHPFMALRDFEAGVRLKNEDSIRWLKNIIPTATISPEFLVREYEIGKNTIREVQTVSFDKPLGVIHFEFSGAIEELIVQYASNLRYMWPYNNTATESINYQYNKVLNGHIVSGQKGKLNTVVTYSQVPATQSTNPNNDKLQVNISTTFRIKNAANINIYVSGSTKSVEDAVSNLIRERASLATLYLKSNRYYRSILNNYLSIETPDKDFNEGYQWALARTDQFLQTSPVVGTSLMAGFGTTAKGWNGHHAISGRPGYAWYFGRDAEWSAMAINAYGDFKMVKEVLRSFVKYQDINGKIYHELTSNGVAHYDAADATPLFIVLVSHYLKYSGDLELIRELWPAIQKAYGYCKSTDTDGDGLIENTNVGHGWIEGGSLFGAHSEFYLVGCWAATLDAMSYISSSLNNKSDANMYAEEAKRIKRIIDEQFWNRKQNFFYVGKMKDGSFMADVAGYSTVPVYLNAVTDENKIRNVNERISSKYFSTDWGLRMLEDSSAKYHPGSYHSGMVWPLYSGWAALSQFKTGHNISGYKHIMNSLMVYKNWALGSVEETLNGSVYKPNGVCHHQCWSETMVVQPVIEGLLGVQPDALSKKVKLSPYFPWHWDTVCVKNIRVQNTMIDFSVKRSSARSVYRFSASNNFGLSFAPRLPLGTTIHSVSLDGAPVPFIVKALAEGMEVSLAFQLKKGSSVLSIEHSGGIGYLPNLTQVQPGDSSRGMQMLTEELNENSYSVVVQALPGQEHYFELFSVKKPEKVIGAEIISVEGNTIGLRTKFPNSSAERYVTKKIKIVLKE